MMNEMKNILNEGGASETMIDNEVVETVLPEEVVEPAVVEEPVVTEEPVVEPETPVAEEPATEEPVEYSAEEDEEKKCPECGKPESECECEDEEEPEEDKKDKYTLEEIPEYVELLNRYSELETKYNDLVAEKETQDATISSLTAFKLAAERKEKQEMINQFYMLSDEEKSDVITNIDTYSLDDIEAKLSIICVRNKVSFDLDDDKTPGTDPMTYNLNGSSMEDDATPAWIKAVMATAKTLN